MRLFIAIEFNEEIKGQLKEISDHLKRYARKGSFTLRDNFHLTLVFLGETDRVKEIQEAMEEVAASPFSISFGGLGKFRRQGGDIYWIGVDDNKELGRVYTQLADQLRIQGFEIEDRPYKPHLTLGRQVQIKEEEARGISLPILSINVTKISLMKSERVQGRLTYTQIYAKDLR